MTTKEEMRRKVRVSQLKYLMDNCELEILKKEEEIQTLREDREKHSKELEELEHGGSRATD